MGAMDRGTPTTASSPPWGAATRSVEQSVLGCIFVWSLGLPRYSDIVGRRRRMLSPASGEWKQAHSQARFVIMQVMLEAGEDFLTVKEVVGEDGKSDLLITMNREKIMTVGKKAIADFLCKLQVYKSTGDICAAKSMYDRYSEVSEPWASRRQIVVDRKQPRTILVQANTVLEDEKLKLVQYDPSTEGMVKSWAERFPDISSLDTIIAKLADKDRPYWG